MKIYLISDNADTFVGMKLAGIRGVVVHTREELDVELDKALKQKDIGVLLISEKLAALIPEKIKKLKLSARLPLVVEVPGREGSIRPEEFITDNIKKSIGIKI